MLPLTPEIATLIGSDEIAGAFWLVKLELEGGTQYFSERKIITWDGHVWSPLLDPDQPIDDVQQHIQIDEKNDTAFNLVNVNGGISALLATNDFENQPCTIYLYFPSIGQALQCFHGFAKKPESMNDLVVTVPVVSFLFGPRVKLPSRVFACSCGFTYADGFDCPYNPSGGVGVVDPSTGLPFTRCPKSKKACIERGMFDPDDPHTPGYYGGFDKWSLQATGKDHSTGLCGIGVDNYTSDGKIQDNFLTDAVPLIYGKIRLPAIPYFWVDESEFLLVGGFLGEGQLQMEYTGSPHHFTKEFLCNGQPVHDPSRAPFDCPGYPGQYVPDFGNRPDGRPYYDADPFCSTGYVIMRIKDEVGIQDSKQIEISARIMGRMVRVYWLEGQNLQHGTYYSEAPHDVLLDLMCNPRGGLGRPYDSFDLPLLISERAYSEQMIVDWDGQTRKRFALAGVILDQQPACDVLERIRDEFSMWFRDYGNHVEMGFIKPNQASVFTFSEAAGTLLVGEDSESLVEISEKSAEDVPNKLVVSFLDADNNWNKTVFTLENAEGIDRAGKEISKEKFLGFTTNLGQALRIASNYMERTISGNWHASWKAPLKALAVEVGDVVTLVSSHLPSGQDTFLVTKKVITHDFDIAFEGRLYRGEFFDDLVDDTYEDLLRTSPENPLRPPAEVETLTAAENIVQVDGVNSSEIVVAWTYPNPPDELCKEIEIWWRDTLSPDQSWIQSAVAASAETSAKFVLPIHGYRMLEIRARAVSRYGIKRDLDNEAIPEVDLLVDGTLDDNVPDAPADVEILTRTDDPTIPPGFFRVRFNAGANNWHGVHTLYIECNETLPFSDGVVMPSGGFPVSGNGVIEAGGTAVFCEGKTWSPHDSALIGCLAIVNDGLGNIQARMVADNTADTIITSGPWYLPDGTYAFEVRSDFTKANYRGFMFTTQQGDFSPAARSFVFDLPLTEITLFFRVCAFNAYGKSAWVTTAQAVSNYSVDVSPAPLVSDFAVTSDGFVADDGTQQSMVTFTWTPPSPLENFSHVIVFADMPIPGKTETERTVVGEFWETGSIQIMTPSADNVAFYCVSINKDGWFDPNWYTNGENQPGGYRLVDTVISGDSTTPPAPATLTATYNGLTGKIDVVWTRVAIPDLQSYIVELKKAATEGGLETAEWAELCETYSTIVQYTPAEVNSGWWFKFRVKALDNVQTNGTYRESNAVQAYAAGTLTPAAVPINLGASGAWEYRNGVPIVYLTFTWDNPPDPNYGGCEVWLVYPAQGYGELFDRVSYQDASFSKMTAVMNGQAVTMRLVPFNKAGVVPAYGFYAETGQFTLSPATFGETVPAPDITARDGIGTVSLLVDVPAWSGMYHPYNGVAIYVSKTNNSAEAHLVGKWPVAHASGSAERVTINLPLTALENVTGGPWVEGEQYYFFGKLESKSGAQSAFSVDTDHSAVFLPGAATEKGAPDFGSNAEVMRIVPADLTLVVAWNAPTVNGSTVFLSQLQVSRNSAFTSLVEDASVNAAAGTRVIGLPENGTYYVRVRYTNHSAAGTSDWFGLREGTAYATVATVAGQTGDTSYIDGASYLLGYYNRIEQSDALQLYFKMSSSATNCLTWWNTTVLWSATQSKLDDANYIAQGGLTLSWADNDGWINVSGATPSTSWIGKVLQYQKNTSPALWYPGIITNVDAVNGKVQINVNFGPAQSGKTGRVVTGYWERAGVYFEEVTPPGGSVFQKNVDYYLQTAINQIPSPATIYFKMIPHNAVFGPGTAKEFSITTQQKALDIVTKGQGYANDYIPTGTFSNSGYQWVGTDNGTIDFIKTFSFAQPADTNYKADSLVIVIKEGGGTPDPATDPKLVFPVNHTSGSQAYSLMISGLKTFTTYSFRTYCAKNGASGLILGTSSVLTDTNIRFTDGNDLVLVPKSSGSVLVQYQDGTPTYAFTAGIARGNKSTGMSSVNLVSGTQARIRVYELESTFYELDFSKKAADALAVTANRPVNASCSDATDPRWSWDCNVTTSKSLKADETIEITTRSYLKPMKFGAYCVWVDSSGKLRIKSSAPTSDTDGTIVGTQS